MRLGVITATLNSAGHLARAMAGLPACAEHVVVDGGSRDATAEVARTRAGTRWIALPGSSIYEAWNAGLDALSADVVCFVNSDDEVRWAAPDDVLARFADDPALDLVNGGFAYLGAAAGDDARLPSARPPAALTLETVLSGACAINARWFRRRLFDRLGPFEPRYTLAADREWLLRCVLARPRQQLAAELTYCYRIHAGSKTLNGARSNAYRIGIEHMAIAEDYLRRDAGPARTALRRFHAEAALTAAAAAWRAGRARDLAAVCAGALRRQPAWPAQVPALLVARLRGRRAG